MKYLYRHRRFTQARSRIFYEGCWWYRGESWPDAFADNYYRWPLHYVAKFQAWWRYHRWDAHRLLLRVGVLRLVEGGYYRDAEYRLPRWGD